MTRQPLANARRVGRRKKLTLEQQAKIHAWALATATLGTKKDFMEAAGKARDQKRRDLGWAKNVARDFGICLQTFSEYKKMAKP